MADTSTGTSPVTHTALVEVNSASTHDNVTPSTVQRGNINNPAPIKIITRKLAAKIREGFVRLPKGVQSVPINSKEKKVTAGQCDKSSHVGTPTNAR